MCEKIMALEKKINLPEKSNSAFFKHISSSLIGYCEWEYTLLSLKTYGVED